MMHIARILKVDPAHKKKEDQGHNTKLQEMYQSSIISMMTMD